uniref:SxtJ n=1 Tax=Candidatus Kentrum sp. MB TaxID=2138164 RepID=A0A451BDT2_9GAMM|nr:MAG: hypothetical protein BECKMB1821G_GA0114241_105220 [Candidatus Kentron sp. MB]VFK33850.1 MAG: hypothetical protein BECKMB1821I_GA0114274_105419 [Candidatus Kentron sp. MB]VFK76439.1 MAG: hypothetical protein BECKMB1821H_GA0114242_105620 [Candidatus Kentron sp. MB]
MSQDITLPSNKSFGFFFSAIFAIGFGYFFLHGTVLLSGLFAVLTVTTFGVTLVAPQRLLFFNRLWLRFGLLLGKIVSPIVLGIIFFLFLSPIAILMRLVGRDELQLKNQKKASYWKERTPAGPDPESFRNQF